MAEHPLRPATDRSLGRPLPYQLANRTWAHLEAAGPKIPAFPLPTLWPGGHTRYYPRFRGAIPHFQVGYPRITHPFAARLAGCPAASLDLHVLGAPPAFILSQDQTLRFEPVNAASPAEAGLPVRYSLKQKNYVCTARSI